jgi:hypothetical protein
MIVDGDREHLLGLILADDIVVEDFADLFSASEYRRVISSAATCSPRG